MADDAPKPAPSHHPHWWAHARTGDGDAFWGSANRRIQFWLAAGIALQGVCYALWQAGVAAMPWLLAAAVIAPALLFTMVVAPPHARSARALLLGLAGSAILLPITAALIWMAVIPFLR